MILYREQAEIVEAPLGVTEYWYELFRRVVIAPTGSDCFLLSIDVYRPDWPYGEPDETLELDGTVLLYKRINELPGNIAVLARDVIIVGLRVQGEDGIVEETISVRLVVCGGKPSYEKVWGIYRTVVMMIEGRDPEKKPLTTIIEDVD